MILKIQFITSIFTLRSDFRMPPPPPSSATTKAQKGTSKLIDTKSACEILDLIAGKYTRACKSNPNLSGMPFAEARKIDTAVLTENESHVIHEIFTQLNNDSCSVDEFYNHGLKVIEAFTAPAEHMMCVTAFASLMFATINHQAPEPQHNGVKRPTCASVKQVDPASTNVQAQPQAPRPASSHPHQQKHYSQASSDTKLASAVAKLATADTKLSGSDQMLKQIFALVKGMTADNLVSSQHMIAGMELLFNASHKESS